MLPAERLLPRRGPLTIDILPAIAPRRSGVRDQPRTG